MSSKAGIVDELHKPARRNYPRRFVTIKGLNDLFQADLVEMIPHSDANDGYKYLLTVINTFSKRAWAVPLKTKTGKEVSGALRKLFLELDAVPKFLQADSGTEFFNANVAQMLKEFGIHLYSSFSTLKASVIERFNRTLKTWMWKRFSLRGNYRWVDMLDSLISDYNNRVHRTIGLAPVHVNKRNEKKVLARLRASQKLNLPPKRKNKFKVGQPVRISKFKHIFEKGYTPNWTTEVFIVDEVKKTRPTTYKLRDLQGLVIQGGFYEEELQKTKYVDTYLVEKILKRKGDQVYVKWLGFDSKYNQWIKAIDVEK